MAAEFEEVVTTSARLREILAGFPPTNVHKTINYINDIARRFIEASPFCMVATFGADGLVDISPKGDPAGFVEVFDEHTLIVPDRPGNQRLDTFENLMVNPAVGLIFVIPGHSDTLRIAGTGRVVRDQKIQARHAVEGKNPVLALVVDVRQAFMHCSKAFVRSRMWIPDAWPERGEIPRLAHWTKTVGKRPESIDEIEAIYEKDAETRLY